MVGGSGAIGQAIGLRLAAMDYRVTLAARSLERLEQARSRLTVAQHDVSCVACDIGDESAVERMVASVAERCGRIDVLVNAAGIGTRDFVIRTRSETWRELLRTNAIGVALVCQRVLPLMKRQGSGHIINIGSIVGRHGRAGLAAYSASKAALAALTDSLREEAERSGVKVSIVSPDRVEGGMQGPAVEGARMLPPSDVAEAVAFLLSLSPLASVPELSLYAPSE